MNVLHVIPSVSEAHGGPSHAIKAFANAAKSKGLSVVVATTDDDGDSARLDVPLSTHVERGGLAHFFFRRDFLPYKISFGLSRWLRQNVKQFDVVHIHALFSFSSFAAARAARKNGVPYIVRPLGVLNQWGLQNRRPLLKRAWLRFVELPMLRRAAAIHYTTEAERTEAGLVDPDIKKIPSFVIPIPVEAPSIRADRGELARRFPQVAGRRVILFLSRLDPKKGLELLLQSFARVSAMEPELLLVIAGDGAPAYLESLSKLADKLRVSEHVLWTGHLGPDDKAAVFAAATIFVLPSHSENFGIAAAEALAAGVPTILSDQVALAADAASSDAAMVVQPEVEPLRAAISQLLKDEALRDRLTENSAKLVKTLYSPEAVGMALAEEYRQIVSRSKAHS